MRHRNHGRKLSRNATHRKAMIKNLVRSLFEHERIITTVEKAKEARPFAERLITLAKEKDLRRIRMVADRLRCSGKFEPAPAPEVAGEDDEDDDDKKKAAEAPREVHTKRWDARIVKKLFDDIGPRFKDRPGGYTRILRLAEWRKGDAASRVIFELVESAPAAKAEASKGGD